VQHFCTKQYKHAKAILRFALNIASSMVFNDNFNVLTQDFIGKQITKRCFLVIFSGKSGRNGSSISKNVPAFTQFPS